MYLTNVKDKEWTCRACQQNSTTQQKTGRRTKLAKQLGVWGDL
jgi:hypothetical protein